MYFSDTIANVKLTIPQAVRNKKIQKDGFKCPDLLILEPRGKYAGLLIELKIKTPYKKNGELYKNKHLQGQQDSLNKLFLKGYMTGFAWSFDMAKKMIDNYMKLNK